MIGRIRPRALVKPVVNAGAKLTESHGLVRCREPVISLLDHGKARWLAPRALASLTSFPGTGRPLKNRLSQGPDTDSMSSHHSR